MCTMTACFDNSSDDNGCSDCVISFTMDGTSYSFTKGYNDISGPPEGSIDDTETTPVYTYLAAVPSDATDQSEYVMIMFFLKDGGNETDGIIGYNEEAIIFQSRIDGTVYDDDINTEDFEITITENSGDVGSTIEGTFEGSLGNGTSISNGYFKVERVADNTFDYSNPDHDFPNALP